MDEEFISYEQNAIWRVTVSLKKIFKQSAITLSA
jgi:hypothetical protein